MITGTTTVIIAGAGAFFCLLLIAIGIIFYRWIVVNPVAVSFFVFLFCSVIIGAITVDRYYNAATLTNVFDKILIESYGMLFDILVICVFLTALNERSRKKMEIQRYKDDIDDLRNLKTQEAAYRIRGSILRLNRYNFSKIDLSLCHLKNVRLKEANLEGAGLVGAELQYTDLEKANLRKADLQSANLQNAVLVEADLKGAILWKTNLRAANLEKANLSGANLKEADLSEAWLEGANLSGAKGLTAEQLSSVKTLFNAKLDNKILEKVKQDSEYLLYKSMDAES